MRLRSVIHFICSAAALTATFMASGSMALGQPPAPVPPNPQAPSINMPFPLGAQRGTTLDLTLTGTNLTEPATLWTSFPAKVTIPTDNNNGKEAAKLRVLLDVPKDAPLGFHTIRLVTTHGVSNFRMFCVDELPQIIEVDTNRSKSTPQPLPFPCVVAGRADAEISDYFRINAKAGQRISFEVLGRRLGSAFDPQISLYDPRSGRELPGGHSNDAPGLQTDARLTYRFAEAGDYILEIRDTTWRGGADFYYRIRIGDFPCATTTLPMSARRGSQVDVGFAGPNVEGVLPVRVSVPNDPSLNSISLVPQGANGQSGWPVTLAVSDHEELQEHEPNNDQASANRVPVPSGITGRFQEPGDVDHFVFAARKGQRYAIEAQTLEFSSPSEVYMALKDAKGSQVAVSNPATGAKIDYTAPADGDLTLAVEHLLSAGGTSETYHITIVPYEPGFDLTLGIDRFDVAPGSVTPIGIFATRRDYTGPIDISVVGHPDIVGHATINPGQPPAPNQPAAIVYLSARADALPGFHNAMIRGSATINGKTVVQFVNLKSVVSQNLAGLSYPPRNLQSQIGLAVTQKPPFTIAAKFDQPEGTRTLPLLVTISAQRSAGFAEEIVLTPLNLPANITPALKNIPKGQNEIKVQLSPAANAALGEFPISFTGKSKFQNKEFTVNATPATLVIALPFELKFEPSPVKLLPGGKAKVKVTAVRKGGYQGPIVVELRSLPANVTAAKATIAMGQDSAEFELTAAANAAIADKTDVNVLGTATTAGNQQIPSPNFTISVQKK